MFVTAFVQTHPFHANSHIYEFQRQTDKLYLGARKGSTWSFRVSLKMREKFHNRSGIKNFPTFAFYHFILCNSRVCVCVCTTWARIGIKITSVQDNDCTFQYYFISVYILLYKYMSITNNLSKKFYI